MSSTVAHNIISFITMLAFFFFFFFSENPWPIDHVADGPIASEDKGNGSPCQQDGDPYFLKAAKQNSDFDSEDGEPTPSLPEVCGMEFWLWLDYLACIISPTQII